MSLMQYDKTILSDDVSFRLRAERKRLNLDQKKVSALCDVSLKTVQRWEAGTPIPSDKMSLLFKNGFDPQFIFTGSRMSNNVDQELTNMDSTERAKTVLLRVLDVQHELGVEFTKEQLQTLMGYAFEHCPTQAMLREFVKAAYAFSGQPLPEQK